MNQIRFSTSDFDEAKVAHEAKFIYIPINSQVREELVYKVQLTDLNLQDTYYQFSGLTEDEIRIFQNLHVNNRPYEFPDNVHLQVTFEFDLTLYRVDRDVYSLLDWVGDVGGLNEGLYIGFKIVLGLFQFMVLEHLLIEKLYLKPQSPDSEVTGKAVTEE